MLTKKISTWLKQNLFVLLLGASIAIWWGFCVMSHPSVPIFINEADPVYLPVVGAVSTILLFIPLIIYLCGTEFRQQHWQMKLQSIGIALMLSTIVFRPYAYLHAQLFFFGFTVISFFADRQRHFQKPPVFYIACCIYFIWIAISMLWTQDRHEAGVYFNRIVPLASYALMFSLICLTWNNYRQLILLFWRVVCVASVLTIACGIYETQRLGADFWDFIQIKKTQIDYIPVYDILYAWSGTGHPSYNVLWLIAGLTSGFFLFEKRLITRLEIIISCLLILLVVVATQSRIGVVLWLLTALSGLIYVLRHHKYVLWSTLSLAGICGLYIGITQIETISTVLSDPTRVKLANIAMDYLRADPWKGCGLGGMTYDYLESVIGYEFKSWWPQYDAPTMYPHNQFLGDWMQSGILGLIVLLGVIVCGFYDAIRQRSFIGIAYMTAVVVFMFIEMPFHFLTGTTVIAFFLCFIFVNRQNPDCDKETSRPSCDLTTNMR